MATIRKDRRAEYSIVIGLVAGSVVGSILSELIFGEAGAGFLIGAGFGLIMAAAYCGLSGKRNLSRDE